ncbi:MAG: hypothetical protein K0S78_1337 [Thermomicrobiales bacterium]|jgi:hypothetical protein|nr:hypothetical protein [Thermomicrobiales bacterium]MDF3040249.1 hypothetical protein [Thermomicrobiales bacterium]
MYRSTVITSMLIPQSDGHMTRPIGEYLSHFKHLVATGLPIILYVAPSLVEEVRAPNVTVVPTTLEDLPLWRAIQGMELRLPAIRDPVKDTADYLALVNSKTELMRRTIDMVGADATHAFVDFGIFHFIRDKQRGEHRLRALRATSVELVTLPGITRDFLDTMDRVDWRFCGSLFYGPTAAMRTFAEVHQERAQVLLPTLTWEVNVWAWMERHGELDCRWYQAGHNDSIVDFPAISPGRHRLPQEGEPQPTVQ